MLHFFTSLGTNIRECFSRKNIKYHVLFIVVTYGIVTTDTDWLYFKELRNTILHTLFSPAIGIGAIIPLFSPLGLIIVGALGKENRTRLLGWSLMQAALIGLLLSSAYKAFTGRIPPPHALTGLIDTSHGFRFGFMKGGIFWGWPSSHTTIAFAMAFTLISLYPKNKVLRYAALVYAFYIGIGVSLGIHWLSEFVAGGILGTIIGRVVGKSFKNHYS